jgi:hypothetical protein
VRLKWRKRKLFPRVDADGNPLPPQELAARSEYQRAYMRKRRAELRGGAERHSRVGRPRQPSLELRFVPSSDQREIVKLLAGFAVPKDRIVRCIRNPDTRRPIGIPTLEKHFADELDTGFADLNALVVGKLAKKIQEGNIVAIIWTMKNLYGWSDQREVHTHSDVEMKVELSGEQLARELERRGLPSHVFGCDKPTLEIAPPRIGNGHDPDSEGGA